MWWGAGSCAVTGARGAAGAYAPTEPLGSWGRSGGIWGDLGAI